MSTSFVAPALPRIPLVPVALLKAHGVECSLDTRFRAASRLLASLWMSDQGITTGHHIRKDNEGDIITPLGSLLSIKDAEAGRNFISPAVYRYVRQTILLQEEGALFDTERLLRNTISSAPMCFNVFAPMALDLNLGTRAWQILLGDFVKKVNGIRFETSPCRDRVDRRYLMDGTAWDLALDVTTPEGEQAMVVVECKLTESMDGPTGARYRDRYDTASREVELFQDPDATNLRSHALEQLWREHMLAQLAVNERIASRAMFVTVGPRLNRRVQNACRLYADELLPEEDLDYDRVRFRAITLESVIDAIRQAGAVDLAKTLWGRYCDFERVFHLCMAEYTNEQADTTQSAVPSSNDKPHSRRRQVEVVHAK